METTHNPQVFNFFSDNNSIQVNEWYALGMQLFGEGRIGDAKRWLLKSGLNGHAQSAFVLGMIYAGEGKTRRAFRWCRQAALRGHVAAMKYVANAYVAGDGVEADADKAALWTAQANNLCSDVDCEVVCKKIA